MKNHKLKNTYVKFDNHHLSSFFVQIVSNLMNTQYPDENLVNVHYAIQLVKTATIPFRRERFVVPFVVELNFHGHKLTILSVALENQNSELFFNNKCQKSK